MPEPGTLEILTSHLVLILRPLRNALSDFDNFRAFLHRLGWDARTLPSTYSRLIGTIDEIIAAFADPTTLDAQAVRRVFDGTRRLFDDLQNLDESPEGVDLPVFLNELGENLFGVLFSDYIAEVFPALYHLLTALHVIEHEFRPGDSRRPPTLITRLNYSSIPEIISDPASIPLRLYGWGTPEFDASILFGNIVELLSALRATTYVRGVDAETSALYVSAPVHTPGAPRPPLPRVRYSLVWPILQEQVGDQLIELGFRALDLPATETELPGIAIEPLVPREAATEIDLGRDLVAQLSVQTDIGSHLAILIRPDRVQVRYPLEPGAPPPSAGFGSIFVYQPAQPTVLFGQPGATRFQVAGFRAGVNVQVRSGQPEVTLEAGLREPRLIVAAGQQDGFLGTLFGGRDLTIAAPFNLRWSNRTGLSVEGGVGFEVSTAPRLDVGPLRIERIRAALRSSATVGRPPDLRIEAAVGIAIRLGPVQASVADMGALVALVFGPGNAGPLDIRAEFKPPSGLGLAISAGPVSGGGALTFYPDEGRYEGALQLDVYGVRITAIVLVQTIPDSGYSFLIILTAEFPPIQLGMGFTLNGVGGLAGIQRTVAVDTMQSGLRSGALDNVLFPREPVGRAATLFRSLAELLPAAAGRYIFGPSIIIGWGTPSTLLEAKLGVLLEVPDPVRIIILGQISAMFPRREAPVVELHLDVLGIIDFGAKTLSIDASLHDSRIAIFTIFGDMALRLSWGAEPTFAFSVGGLNPGFQPPPNFPALRRVTIALGTSENPRVSLQAYLAITSNSFQVGARAELYAEALGFNVYGWLGFDVLIRFSPFSFLAELDGGIALRSGTTVLAGIHIYARLSGPTPWAVSGSATVTVLFEITVPFELVIGEARHEEIAPVDPLPALLEAVANVRNWSVMAIANATRAVTLTAPASGDSLLDPEGALRFSQLVLPLSRELDKYGNAPVARGTRFDITRMTLSGYEVVTSPTTDKFAAAQFEDMDDAERLSRPSFETMSSGVVAAATAVRHGPVATETIEYEETVTGAWSSSAVSIVALLRDEQFIGLECFNADRALSRAGLDRFVQPGREPQAALTNEAFVVATSDTLATSDSGSGTKGEAIRRLKNGIRSGAMSEAAMQVISMTDLRTA